MPTDRTSRGSSRVFGREHRGHVCSSGANVGFNTELPLWLSCPQTQTREDHRGDCSVMQPVAFSGDPEQGEGRWWL